MQQQQQMMAQRQQQLQQIELMRKQQQMQAMSSQQRQLEDNRKRLEAQNQQRIEMQRQAAEQAQRQQAEFRQKQAEERQRQVQILEQRKLEQAAVLNVRRVMQKLRGVTPDTVEGLEKEVLEVLQSQLSALGSQAEPMTKEAQAGLEQAKQRVETIRENIRKAEEARAEAEKKRQEAIEKADELLKQLQGMVGEAEEASKELVNEADPLTDKDSVDMSIEEIRATAKAVEEAGVTAKEKAKACSDMALTQGPAMRVADLPRAGKKDKPDEPGKQDKPDEPEDRLTLAKLLGRINEATKTTESTLRMAKTAEEKAVKRVAAKKKVQASEKVFDKYDVNKDGMLDQKEVTKYAQKELGFKIPAAYFEGSFKVLIGDAKGVKKANFQQLKMSIGIQREQAKDAKRKEARVEREKELEKMKEELEEKVKEATKDVDTTDSKVTKCEADTQPLLLKAKTMSSPDMAKMADEIDEQIKDAREDAAAAKTATTELAEDCEAELKTWLALEQKKLDMRINRFDVRLTKAATLCGKFREELKKKATEEIGVLEKKVIKLLKYHQRAKDITSEDLFVAVDADKDDKISESEWLAFFKTCEREPPAPEKEGEDEAGKKDEAAAEPPTEEELSRVWAALDEDEEGAVSKDRFASLVRNYMKVAKDTVITSGASIKDSKTLRRLDAGEIVEVVRGPCEEGTVKVMRVQAKVMKDDLEGWITVSGNQGTTFLEEGGNIFKVVAETILTDAFELDGGDAGAAKKVKDTTRKLKIGELVEVRAWAKKEEKSGLLRMKCKCLSDGSVGWATTFGNQGTEYLKVV